jgi:Zn2+/Cd2+-exporting ATPase
MTTLAPDARPLSRTIREDAEPALTSSERRRIAIRLGGAIIAGACLAAGLLHRHIAPDQPEVTALLLAAGAIVATFPILRAGARGFRARDPDSMVDQLLSLALLAALATGDFETAILVPLLLQIGHFFEERSILGARAAIEGLRTLRPRRASRRVGDHDEELADVEALRLGDRLVVRPGEVFPADGRVLRGTSAVDQSTMTGESVPEETGPGLAVFAGTLNLSGVLEVEVTGLGDATALGRVVGVPRETDLAKAPVVRLIERYARYYLPAVLLVAAATLAATQDLSRAITILVVSCPCALVLASPSAMTAALAVAARLGILVKNARFLETLGEVDTVILDKTGTATMGHLDVVDVKLVGARSRDELVGEAEVCARGSRHPVSRAVLALAGPARGDVVEIIEELPGRGVLARRNGIVVRLGSRHWLHEAGLELPEEPVHPGPIVWVARDREVLGLLLLADRPRPGGREALAALRRLGVPRLLLMTGDRPDVARHVAGELGIDDVYAACLPEAKLTIVEREKADGRRVMVIGDGVNDAPALGRADVGVAMGAMGSDMAVRSADIALMGQDLARLPQMIRLSRWTRAIINQNVLFAVASGLLVMVAAALGVITPVSGALLQNVGTVLVIVNSARLLHFDPDAP